MRKISKYTLGKQKSEKATKDLKLILTDLNNPLFLSKDTEFAETYGVTRLTIYNIRLRLGIPPRSKRIVQKLKTLKTNKFTIKELSDILGIKYQNLYKIVVEEEIPVKNDTPPIKQLLDFQKKKMKKLAKSSVRRNS